jgi:hypothetical protein
MARTLPRPSTRFMASSRPPWRHRLLGPVGRSIAPACDWPTELSLVAG